MSKDSDLQSKNRKSPLDVPAAAKYLLRKELIDHPVQVIPAGIYPVLPSIRTDLFEDVKFVGDDVSHLRNALRLFMEKQGKDFYTDTDVLEALALAASEHLFPVPPPKKTRGQPAEDDLVKFLKARAYLLSAGRVAALLELRGQGTSQEDICREIIRRKWKIHGRDFTEEDVFLESRRGESSKLSSAKREFIELLDSSSVKKKLVGNYWAKLTDRQKQKITYEWAPSKTEMEYYPQWDTIYAKHNFGKKLLKKLR